MTFKAGDKPGPGRGNKKPVKPLTIEQIELALQLDLKSKDPKVRHPATRLLLALKKQIGQLEADNDVIDRWVLELMGFLNQMQENIHQGTGQNVTGLDVIRKMSKTCLACQKVGAVDANLREVDDADD